MIDSVANLLLRCSHRRLTRPVTPVSKTGVPHGQTYVVCLDCGKQFSYDLREMRVGKPLERSHDAGVLHPDMPEPSRKLKYALWASLPLAFLAGAFFRNGRKTRGSEKKKD
jgi:DNA-directed RNA polymerase subunit RPC12/RpoP